MSIEPKSQFTVIEMTTSDVDEASVMRMQSWLDTYPNEEHGVTREWVEKKRSLQLSEVKRQSRKSKFEKLKAEGLGTGWVAKDPSGVIIGATTPWIDESGVQHVGSLYVAKEWHGTGVASTLMQKVIDWFDPTKPIVLGVASYNERAKAFYRKWGFVETDDSEELFDGVIPEINMARKGDKQ